MEGPPPDRATAETRGVIPRAVDHIFRQVDELATKGWSYDLTAFYVEIYNEALRDLLAAPGTPTPKGGLPLQAAGERGGHPRIPGLTVESVTSADAIQDLLRRAQANRSTAGTGMNDQSSRSHSVFQLRLAGTNSATGERVLGLLNLIDLAGSERIAKSGVQGDRLAETKAINKSLSCLGDVIAALASKAKHVPYRNSKLTHLLANSLGGNSKTLMFVNVAPGLEHQAESLSSLRFAAKVNSCEIGTARRAAGQAMH
jgi:kinesin family protein C1